MSGFRARWQALGEKQSAVILLAVVAILPMILPGAFYYRVFAVIWIFGLAAIGFNLLVGYAGQVSLGHAGFMGLGAYAVALGPAHLGLPTWLALLLGVAGCGLLAFVIGRPILRLKGHYLAVATLGFGILIAMALNNETGWTGGPDGMPVPALELFGWRVRGAQTWYWVTGLVLVLGAWTATNLIASATGRALRAIHDSETAAAFVGVNVPRYKLIVFVISAMYAALAGALLALLNGHITPTSASFLVSIELLVMVVLGGMGSILGSVVGAVVLVALPQALTVFHEYEHIMLGAIMIACMVFLPAGVVPSVSKALAKRAR
jgi:branched-chain amino acid transport system permease protein